MEYKVYDCESFKIHTIKVDKFKNCTVEIMFRNKVEKENITENNMLVDMLMHSSKKYPKRRDVSIELENLYSTFLRGTVTRLGSDVILSFVMDFLNPKYCEKGFLEDVLSMPFEMILNPNIVSGEFDKRSFNIIKNRLKSDIESLKENAMRFAFRRSLTLALENSPSSYYMVGYLDDLENITPKSLVDTYNNLFNNYECDIYVVGNLEMDKVVDIIKKKFTINSIKTRKNDLYVKNKLRKKVQDIDEKGNYEQDSLVLVYNLDKLTKKEQKYTMHLYSFILGSGGLTSKLYRYLREENSLCYLASSMYQKYDGLLMVYAGINKKDKKKAVKLVKKAIDEMVNGDFTDEELANTKKAIISSIKVSEDSNEGIINNYLFNEIDDLPMPEERIREFKAVTREEIMECAKKVKLNTIYLLGGEK